MPDPSAYGNDRDAFMRDCVPMMVDEGKPQDQAVAACSSMWEDRGKAAAERLQKAYDGTISRAYSRLDVKAIDDERRTIKGIATTPTLDRDGDIVEPMGAQFAIPMALMLDHNHTQQVGHVVFAKPTKTGIPFEASIVKFDEPGEVKNLVDKAWHLVKTKLRSFVSIGFKPLADGVELLESGGLKFNKWEWVELSLVSLPANREAVIMEAKSLDAAVREITALDQGKAASGHSASRPGASGKPPVNLKLKERSMSKTIAEQIEALQAARASKDARMDAIMAKAMDEGRSTDEAEKEEFDTLKGEVEQIDEDLKRFDFLERRNRAKATPVSQVKTVDDGAAVRVGNGPLRLKGPDLGKGVRFARVVKCVGLAKGSLHGALSIAESMYSDDHGIQNVLKAATMAGTVTDATWAGNLVGDETSVFADFVEFLRPMTVLGKFGNNGIPALRRVPFRTALISQTTGMTGYWVGEGQGKPVTSAGFSRTTLEPLKVANITVVTEELLRDSSPSAETVLRDELAASLTERLDTDFIDPAKTAVAGISPASITSGVSAITASGVTADAVRQDVLAIMTPFLDADNPPRNGVWIMSTTTALALSLMQNSLGQPEFPSINLNGGTFMGLPVIVSDYVPTSGGSPNTRYVILANASDIYMGDEGGINIDMSREASLEMSTTPTNAVSGPGGSPLGTPTASTLVSLWQTNSVGFRAERTINWSKRRTSAVQVLTGVVWGT